MKDHAAELAQHRASIEIDVGTWHPLGYETYASDSLLQALRPLRTVLGKMSSGVVRIRESGGDMDDYAPSFDPFCDCKDYYASHHTVADTFAMIDPRGLQENSALVAVLAFAMASVPNDVIQHPKPKPR
jgi:hypothetical protein